MPSSDLSNQVLVVGAPVVNIHNEYYLSPHFGRAPLFAFIQISSNSYKILEVVENPHIRHEHGRGRAIVELLASRDVSAVILLGVGYGAFHMLKEHGIKVYYVPVQGVGNKLVPLSKAIEMFMNRQLEEAVEPRELY